MSRFAAAGALLALLVSGCLAEDVGDVSSIEQAELTGRPAAGNFVIHVIDVSTGLAVFVWGRDFTLLYDGGSNDDRRTGDNNRVLAYLNAVGFPPGSTIDHLVLSHPTAITTSSSPTSSSNTRCRTYGTRAR